MSRDKGQGKFVFEKKNAKKTNACSAGYDKGSARAVAKGSLQRSFNIVSREDEVCSDETIREALTFGLGDKNQAFMN